MITVGYTDYCISLGVLKVGNTKSSKFGKSSSYWFDYFLEVFRLVMGAVINSTSSHPSWFSPSFSCLLNDYSHLSSTILEADSPQRLSSFIV